MMSKKENKIPLLIILSLVVGFVLFLIKPQIPSISLAPVVESIDTIKIKKELLNQFKGSYSGEIDKNGKIVEYDMLASESVVDIIPGIKTKVWNYNGQVPGPEIRISLGDTLKLSFKNDLPQETTIHWHGVRVPNAMDGVPGVTQDPIQPGETFIYEFTPKDSGTFWFHPHVKTAEQMERGLYGILIVEDPQDTEFYQDEVIVIDDWRLLDNGQIDPRFVTGGDLMHDGRWGNIITVNGKTNATLNIEAGSTSRLRFVNTSNARAYRLNFGKLKATAIAVDGMKVGETFNADGFELSPGNRIDVVINVPENEVETTFIIKDTFTRNAITLLTLNVNNLNQDFSMEQDIVLPTADHFPDWSKAVQIKPDHEYVLDARRATGSRMGMMNIEWTINGQAFPDIAPISLKANKFNKIRFTNASGRLHPMHLHGQFFQVIARDGTQVSEPYWRDTVLLHPRETVDIGIVPLDKGKWANHCHILEHAESGMMTIVEVE